MITEQQILNEAQRQSDSRLNGHDVDAFVRGAKWVCQKLNIPDVIQRSEQVCVKFDCSCVHRYNENKCGIEKCQYI